jgi:hypothetical protein
MKQCIDLTYSAKELKKTERQCEKQRLQGIYFCIGYFHIQTKTSSSSIERPKKEAQPTMVESVNAVPLFS